MHMTTLKNLTLISTSLFLIACGSSIPENKDIRTSLESKLSDECKKYIQYSNIEKTNGYADGEKYQVEFKSKLTLTPPKDWASGELKKAEIYKKYLEEYAKVTPPNEEKLNELIRAYNNTIYPLNALNSRMQWNSNPSLAAEAAEAKIKMEQAKKEMDEAKIGVHQSKVAQAKVNQKYASDLGISLPNFSENMPKEEEKTSAATLFSSSPLDKAAKLIEVNAVHATPPQSFIACLTPRVLPMGVLQAMHEGEMKIHRLYEKTEVSWQDKFLMRKTEQGWSPVENSKGLW